MKANSQIEVHKLMEDLTSQDAWLRRSAAEELGRVSESSLEIVTELAAATEDENRVVRAAARQALQASVHQEVLVQHPEIKTGEIVAEKKASGEVAVRKYRPILAILLGIVAAILAAIPVSLIKSFLAFSGFVCGIFYTGDSGWFYPVFILLGSGLFGFLADRWKKNLWLSFLAGIVFDVLFVFIYFGQ